MEQASEAELHRSMKMCVAARDVPDARRPVPGSFHHMFGVRLFVMSSGCLLPSRLDTIFDL